MTIETSNLIAASSMVISLVGTGLAIMWKKRSQEQMEGRYLQRIDHLEKVVENLEKKIEDQQKALHQEQLETRKIISKAVADISKTITDLQVSMAQKSIRSPRRIAAA